ncbi:MAG: DNA-binding transcriptional LysR family regulator [Planctomycetota bacterium]|jgi:DNA-binding transcriptional LysR family regulator
MDKLRAMALFKKVAETGSFSQAADELNVSKSMISKELSKLENQIGSRLLQRNTRNLQLTEIGTGYLKRCRQILMQVKDADSFVQFLQSKPIGKLKINAPMSLGITDLRFVFSEFMQAYPEIELDISLSDEYVDLIEEDYDIGFRAMSQLQDLNYIGRPIAEFKLHIVAAPGYLNSNPEVKTPDDLVNHNCFSYTYATGSNSWPIDGGVEISGQLSANSTLLLKQAALDGLGIALLPSFVCKSDLNSKKLIEILPSCKRPSLKFYVLYPAREFIPPKITLCVNFIQQWFLNRKV